MQRGECRRARPTQAPLRSGLRAATGGAHFTHFGGGSNAALADGTIDALVSDHTPVDEDAKTLPFAEAEPGATGLELLLSLALKWSQDSGVPLQRALAAVTCEPARVLGNALGTLQASVGQIVEGGVGDICILDPQAAWTVQANALRSQGKHTPFSGYELPGCVRMTLVGGQVAFER